MTVFYDKEDLEEMLEISTEDFKNWKTRRKVACLRDASNKLIAVAENLTTNKIQKRIRNWGEFRRHFLEEYKDQELLNRLSELHRFFYEDLGYDESYSDVEYRYHKAFKALRTLVAHWQPEKKIAYA